MMQGDGVLGAGTTDIGKNGPKAKLSRGRSLCLASLCTWHVAQKLDEQHRFEFNYED
jgi:hypothetical protein